MKFINFVYFILFIIELVLTISKTKNLPNKLYHGTKRQYANSIIERIDFSKLQNNIEGTEGQAGFYTTKSPNGAFYWATQGEDDFDRFSGKRELIEDLTKNYAIVELTVNGNVNFVENVDWKIGKGGSYIFMNENNANLGLTRTEISADEFRIIVEEFANEALETRKINKKLRKK